MPTSLEEESLKTYDRFVAGREEVDSGQKPWYKRALGVLCFRLRQTLP